MGFVMGTLGRKVPIKTKVNVAFTRYVPTDLTIILLVSIHRSTSISASKS